MTKIHKYQSPIATTSLIDAKNKIINKTSLPIMITREKKQIIIHYFSTELEKLDIVPTIISTNGLSNDNINKIINEMNSLDELEKEYGICCFCGNECNICSQSCGRCVRNG